MLASLQVNVVWPGNNLSPSSMDEINKQRMFFSKNV